MGDNRFEELPQKFAFFWKSDDNPEKYIIYDHQNQVLLNILLSKFLNNQNYDIDNLLGDYKLFSVNFRKMIHTEKLNINCMRSIIIKENIPNVSSISNQDTKKIEEEYGMLFYWNSNKDPFDSKEKLKLTPYDMEDQIILSKAFNIYLKNPSKYIIYLKTIPNYYIDFSRMLQFSEVDNSKIRPVYRSNPYLISNMLFLDKFNDTYTISNKLNYNLITDFNGIDSHNFLDSLERTNKKIIIIYFNVFSSCIAINVDNNFCFFPDNYHIKISLDEIKIILVTEINILSKLSNSEYSFNSYFTEINQITDEETFFKTMVKLYTKEGFLYKKMNEFLRIGAKHNYDYIKYYYTFMLFSFQYFSSNIQSKYFNRDEDLIVYRGSQFSDSELEDYLNKQDCITIRIFREFLSTTDDPTLVSRFFHKNDESKKEIFWEIRIPIELIKSEPFNFCNTSEYSVFNFEKEIILKSGSVVLIEETFPYSEVVNNEEKTFPNKYRIKCTLKSFYVSSFECKNLLNLV